MQPQGMTSGYAFADNPIIYSLKAYEGIVEGGEFRVELGSQVIYRGKFTLPVTLNLSELLMGMLPLAEPPVMASGSWVGRSLLLTEAEQLPQLQLIVEYDNGADQESAPVKVMRGGLIPTEYREMIENGEDIFTERFLNPAANFFLTTRSSEKVIEIPERELYPLAFIFPQGKKLKVAAAGLSFLSSESAGGIYWFFPGNLRRKIFSDSNGKTLVNEFKVGYEDSASRVTIVITRSEIARNPVVVTFRNGFDIPELIAFDGILTALPSSEEDSSEEYLRYDSVTDDFLRARERVRPGMKLRLDTGIVAPRDIPRLLEMLGSREVWLSYSGERLQVIPACEISEIPLRPEAPQEFSIEFHPVDGTIGLSPFLFPSKKDVTRLFSIEHNEKFN